MADPADTPTNPAAVVEQAAQIAEIVMDRWEITHRGQEYAIAKEAALLGIEQGRAEMREEAAKLLDGDGGKVIPLLAGFAPLVSGNNMPCMSGDARDRLRPHVRQRFDDGIASVAQAIRAIPTAKERG